MNKECINPGPLIYLEFEQVNNLSLSTLINYAYESAIDSILTVCLNRKDFAIAVSQNSILMQKINNDPRIRDNKKWASSELQRILNYQQNYPNLF
jgi:hypothetical protein